MRAVFLLTATMALAACGWGGDLGQRRYSVTVALDPPLAKLPVPPVEGPAGRPLVVIDAGHGGHDPGAISPDGRREKDATLGIARAIRDKLLADGRVRVALTRDDDSFLALGERYSIAQRLGAGLFISIHADSAPNPLARGATIYTLSEVASDREAAALAAKENKADIIDGVNLSGRESQVTSILIDLAQRETMGVSADFAWLLHREAANDIAFRPVWRRFAGLVVLKAPDVPSLLFETGYISNGEDTVTLFSPEGRARIAEGVAKAVETHFAKRGIGR